MFVKTILPLILIFPGAVAYADLQSDRQSPVVLDENVWVAFYDLPSRRFRAIRAAILTRNNESATPRTSEQPDASRCLLRLRVINNGEPKVLA